MSALQGYKMKDESQSSPFFVAVMKVEGGIRTAVKAWCTNKAAAKAQYGPIASWDTSEVTDMSFLFSGKAVFNEDISRWDVSNVTSLFRAFERAISFNGDLSRWDVSNVTSMFCTFWDATSFNQQLSGSWSDSSANRLDTFGAGCPGSIA